MQKTDSVVNLTKPSLYGIYNASEDILNKENDEVEEYISGTELHIKSKEGHAPKPLPPAPKNTSSAVIILRLAASSVAVAAAAFVYNEVAKNVHNTHANNHAAKINTFVSELMGNMSRRGNDVGITAQYVSFLFVQGVVLSSILPVLDRFMPQGYSQRMLSSNPNRQRKANVPNDIVRASIAFLGISYAIRNIEWTSPHQMVLTWSLLNPGLWLILDGTVTGFVASAAVAFGGSAFVYGQNRAHFLDHSETLMSSLLLIASFFFCGVIIFGKLGRILYEKTFD